MSDSMNFAGSDEQDPNEPLDPNIRAALKAAQADRARVNELEREIAFTKAGVPDDTLGTVFRKGWDGDTTPEAIKAAWDEIAPAPPAAPPSEPDGGVDPQLQAELDAQQRIAQVGASGEPGSGEQTYEDAIRSAKSEAEVLALIRQAPATATDYDGRRIAPVEVL